METVAEQGVVDRPVKTTGSKQRVGTGTIRLREYSQQERTSRAMKRLGLVWLLAIPAAGIPPHIPWFVLVILSGPLFAWLASSQTGTIFAQEIPGPDCGAPTPVEEQPESWPLNARCRKCGCIFGIEKT
jgi:hypothetical protein